MIELQFEHRNDCLKIIPQDKKYSTLARISARGWITERVEEDLEWTIQCKEGTFKDEDGETDFFSGCEGALAEILVRNGDRAYLVDSRDGELDPYLIFTFDELIEILTQMRDYLKSIGK
jgi:hypothetical protein